MITINRKDTYDRSNREENTGREVEKCGGRNAGRDAERAGPEAGGGEQSTGREDLSSGSGEQVERCGARRVALEVRAHAGQQCHRRRLANRGLRAPSPHTIFGNTRATPSGGHGTWPVNLGSVKVGEGPAARLSVNVAPGQFRMILTRKHSSSQARKQLGLKRAKGHRRKRASAQARVRKLPDHGPWNKYHGSGLVGLD